MPPRIAVCVGPSSIKSPFPTAWSDREEGRGRTGWHYFWSL
jgi:hypothetical protein